MPLFSVIMPAFNAQATLLESVRSILKQSFQDWELLICDDASTDGTEGLLLTLTDPRIRRFRNERNSGTAKTRNHCLAMARGRYIAFLDADDLWDAGVLQAHLDAHTRFKPGITYGDYSIIDWAGNVIGQFTPAANVTLESLLKTCDIGLLTACVDRQVSGDFSFPISPKEDYALWLVMCRSPSVRPRRILDLGCRYRLSQNSISSNKWKEIVRQWHVIRTFGQCDIPSAVVNIAIYASRGLQKHLFAYRGRKRTGAGEAP